VTQTTIKAILQCIPKDIKKRPIMLS